MSITIGMFATALIPNLNRRPQFILGALSLALHMFLLGFDNYLGWSSSIPSLNYFPIVLLISFGFNYGIGIGTIPFTLTGEIFPQQLRTYGCSFSLAFRYIYSFIQLKMFFLMVSSLGMSGTYWFQGSIALFGCVFAFCLLPETRNKTLTELEQLFERSQENDAEKELYEQLLDSEND